MRRLDAAAKIAAAAAAAVMLTLAATVNAAVVGSFEAPVHAIALLMLVVFVLLVLLRLMYERLCCVRDNLDEWVRICCRYRRGLRDCIAKEEFATLSGSMAALDRVDGEGDRAAEQYKKRMKELDADDAMPG